MLLLCDFMKTFEVPELKYFVSFVDILGFRNILNNNLSFPGLSKIYRSIDRTLYGIREIHRTGKPNEFYDSLIPLEIDPYVYEILTYNFYNFSDSIILYISASDNKDEDIKRLGALCWITNVFIAKSILVGDNRVFELPLRAGIAYGPAVMDGINKIHIGKPIVDAYELAEHQNWMGGAIHPSVPQKILKSLIGSTNEIVEYNVPIREKDTDENGYKIPVKFALNWVQQHPSHSIMKKFHVMRPTVEDIGKSHVLKHNWGKKPENLIKKEETIKFIKTICSEYDKLFKKSFKKEFLDKMEKGRDHI